MSRKKAVLLFVLVLAAGAGTYAYRTMTPAALVLTGIVTTNDVIVSPQIAGQIGQLLVTEGDPVTQGQLVAVITPDELKADTAYFARNVEEARSVFAYMRSVANRDSKQVDATKQKISESRALLKQ